MPSELETIEIEDKIKNEWYGEYWNSESEKITAKLWIPTTTNESYDKNKYKTQYYHKSEPVDIKLENKTLNTDPITISKKLRIYPNKEQRSYYNKNFKAHTYIYNQCIDYINTQYQNKKETYQQHPTCIFCNEPKILSLNGNLMFTCAAHLNKKINWDLKIETQTLRDKFTKTIKNLTPDVEWQRDIYKETKDFAITSALAAYKSACTNKKRGNINYFDFKIKSHEARKMFSLYYGCMQVENGKLYIMKRELKDPVRVSKRTASRLPTNEIKHNGKLFYDRGKYYLLLSEQIEREHTIKQGNVIALDPGIRTFQTGYSPDGNCYKFGNYSELDNVVNLCKREDLIRSKIEENKENHSRLKYMLRRKLANIKMKVTNIINNLHNNVASYLAKNYKNVLLPEFGTAKMLRSETLTSINKRRLQLLSHFKFNDKLQHLCNRYGSIFHSVNESFTTKCCGKCGNKKEVNGDKIYNCLKCSYVADRDLHGARNILIKTHTINSN